MNEQPQLRLVLDVKDDTGAGSQTTLKQVFPLTMLPAVGQQLPIVLSPGHPDEAFLAEDDALRRDDPVAERQRMLADIPEHMVNNPVRVGDIVAITPLPEGEDSYQVSTVRIGHAPAPVFCRQRFTSGHPYTVGDRVYLTTDGLEPPRHGYILPPSYNHGNKLPNIGNRIESFVLADAVLFAGARASGEVRSATEMPFAAAYREQGYSKWALTLRVTPADGSPAYDGEVTVSVGKPEKAAVISADGATLPLRYDPYDKLCFTIDTIALGWGDPSLTKQKFNALVAAEQARVAAGLQNAKGNR